MNSKKQGKTLTVIINSKAGYKNIKKFFESLKKQLLARNGDIQVIVVGDYLDSKTEEKIKDIYKNFEIEICTSKQDALKKINGQFVNFSNGIDLWNDGALDLLCDFLHKNKDIKCAIGKALLSRKKTGKRTHSKNNIYDTLEEPQLVVDKLKNMVIHSELIDTVPDFFGAQDEESSLLALSVLLKIKKFVDIPDAIIWNREITVFTYEDKEKFIHRCMDMSNEICGSITDYAYQFMFASIYRGFIKGDSKEETVKCLKLIPDDIIGSCNLNSKNGRLWEEKRYAYQLKNGDESIQTKTLDKDGRIYFGKSVSFDIRENSLFQIVILTVDSNSNTLVLEGYDRTNYIDQKAESYIKDELGNTYPLEIEDFKYDDLIGCEGEIIQKGRRFKVCIPLHFGMKINFMIKYSLTGDEYACKFSRGIFLKLHPHLVHAYYEKKPYIIQLEGNTIKILRDFIAKHFVKEILYLCELVSCRQTAQACYRMLYWLNKAFGSKKPIWIINDRPHNAGDNGEALFKYLMQSPLAETHNIYFMLSEKSPDFERVSKIGPVLKYYSRQHKLKFLQAEKIISSIGNELPTNPFGGSRKIYYDLYRADFIYLRHGVSHNDQSAWLNKFRRNYALINSTSKQEYESLLTGNYLYTDKEVVLCGLPRYDNLSNDSKNKILFLPTWRKNLQGEKTQDTEQRSYSDNFINSEFYSFYNRLINDERLLQVMKKHGFTGEFYLHPVMSEQAKDFKDNELIKVNARIADYQKEFKESNIMVTDYSSVAFDFAYLKKPVVYAQFDIDDFYKEHSWDKGYFSYERDAFGPTPHNYEDTVNAIIKYLENDCKMEENYINKVDKFFAYTDRNNCKRITEAILNKK